MITDVSEAAEAIVLALVMVFADADEDDPVPLRKLLEGVGKHCGVELTTGDLIKIDEEISVAELRRRGRCARQELAQRGMQ